MSATASDPALRTAAFARLLSVGFSEPAAESLGHLQALAQELASLDPGDEDLPALAALAADSTATELEPEYEALFGGAVRCPPYEGSYEADPFRQTRQMADVAGFYRAFGAEVSGPATERPDHAGCELEFFSFLVARRLAAEAEGLAEQAEVCREAEEAFLRDHLGRWLGAFCRAVGEAEPVPFYGALARLGQRFIAVELTRRGIEPEPLPRRRRWSVEADSFECGPGEPRT
jgi:TorA maturation chaperone TorD